MRPFKKSRKYLLICDARAANARMRPPSAVPLATGDSLSRLRIPAGKVLYTAQLDLRDYFPTLRFNGRFVCYSSLPPVQAADLGRCEVDGVVEAGGSGEVWPYLVSVPMGNTWALCAAHRVHERILLLQDSRPPADLADGPVYLAYVDTLAVFGVDEAEVSEQLRRAA